MKKTTIDRSLGEVRGDSTRFSGTVRIQLLHDTAEAVRIQAVFFEPSARTRPHIHVNDQVLQCIAGEGVVAAERKDGTVESVRIKPGEIVVVQRNTWHWHGATRTSGMAHIAVQIHDDRDQWDGVEEKDWALYSGG